VSIHRNEFANPTGGWHIQPTFQVSQHEDHVDALHDLVSFFGCGKVRRKSAGNPVMVYTVHSTKRLLERVLPVFDEHLCESSDMIARSSSISHGRYELAITTAQRSFERSSSWPIR